MYSVLEIKLMYSVLLHFRPGHFVWELFYCVRNFLVGIHNYAHLWGMYWNTGTLTKIFLPVKSENYRSYNMFTSTENPKEFYSIFMNPPGIRP